MTSKSGPHYEVTIFVAPDAVESCESRIEEHVRQVLLDPAVADCIVFARDGDDPERKKRVCLHILASDEALDDFIDGPGSEFEGELEGSFWNAKSDGPFSFTGFVGEFLSDGEVFRGEFKSEEFGSGRVEGRRKK